MNERAAPLKRRASDDTDTDADAAAPACVQAYHAHRLFPSVAGSSSQTPPAHARGDPMDAERINTSRREVDAAASTTAMASTNQLCALRLRPRDPRPAGGRHCYVTRGPPFRAGVCILSCVHWIGRARSSEAAGAFASTPICVSLPPPLSMLGERFLHESPGNNFLAYHVDFGRELVGRRHRQAAEDRCRIHIATSVEWNDRQHESGSVEILRVTPGCVYYAVANNCV